MSWIRRTGALGVVATAALALAVFTGGAAAKPAAHGAAATVQFAEIFDFTGVGSGPSPYANASQLSALYDINAGGGILGEHVDNVIVDTKSDPADGVLALDRALAVDHIAVEAGPSTLQAAALVPILQRHSVITLCGCGNPEFDRSTNPFFWRVIPPDPVGGETMSLDAKQLGYTRVAAVFGTDTGSQGDLPGVLGGVRAAHLKLVANIGLTPDQTSYRTQVAQLVAAKPQVIFTETDGPTAATFYGELKTLGKIVPIFGTNATLQTPYLKALSAAIGSSNLTKYYQVQATAPSPASSKAAQAAAAAYNNGIRHVASHLPSPVGQWLNNSFVEADYDAVITAALAMDAAKSTNPATADPWIAKITAAGAGKTVVYTYPQGVAALKAGKQIQYVGASGPITFDKWHNSFGNQAMQKVTPTGTVISSKIFTAAQIQKLG
ncbi:MAG TPA: ABC transporter substrate-binding protein [Solirubrobacteraceae bacterium]|jgi:branched-chain amino acid transport system substrate-binding protein